VAILDVTPAEADAILAAHDPLALLAGKDSEKLTDLLSQQTGELGDALKRLASQAGLVTEDGPPTLKQLSTQPPPAMSWVLIGMPVVRFGEIAETITQLGKVPGIVLESTVNNG
jgi:hypothetical protein